MLDVISHDMGIMWGTRSERGRLRTSRSESRRGDRATQFPIHPLGRKLGKTFEVAIRHIRSLSRVKCPPGRARCGVRVLCTGGGALLGEKPRSQSYGRRGRRVVRFLSLLISRATAGALCVFYFSSSSSSRCPVLLWRAATGTVDGAVGDVWRIRISGAGDRATRDPVR